MPEQPVLSQIRILEFIHQNMLVSTSIFFPYLWDFFKKAGLGAGALGAVAAGAGAKAAKADPAAQGADGRGYRETAHVKKYYELARF